MSEHQQKQKVVLITGSARRIGANIATRLHDQGYRVVIHYHHSEQPAQQLVEEFTAQRPDSAVCLQADLTDVSQCQALIQHAINPFGRLDALVNNASSFYPTPVAEATLQQWQDLLATNLQAPYFLAQAASEALAKQSGCIINITDIHATKPLKNHSIYCIAKAGLEMLTKSLARELAPTIRVNAIAPGAIAWPEEANAMSDELKQKIIERTPLQRSGSPEDIAAAVQFLLEQSFVTGQTISVDGGRGLS